jgi:hypothetical protein
VQQAPNCGQGFGVQLAAPFQVSGLVQAAWVVTVQPPVLGLQHAPVTTPPTTCTTAAAAVCPSGFVAVRVYFSAPMLAVAEVAFSTRLTVVALTKVAETTLGGVPVAPPLVIDTAR